MPEVNFKPLPADYQELVSALKKHIEQSEKYIADFEHRQYNGTREKAVIYCLGHAVDLAGGCLATAHSELPDSLTTLSRALLETFFWARYVTMSKENAQEFAESTVNEMKRVSRKNLNAGYAKVYDIKTNDDKTKEILNSPLMTDIPKRISIEKAAELGGLERVYTNIYGFISMIAHGRAFDLRTKPENKDEIYASVSAALGALQGVEIITADWIIHRKQTPRETLIEMLGV
jgi:hypothetical protein